MSYRLAVFDLDGTILNTLEDLCDSVNFGLRSEGLKERSIGEVRSFVGNGIRNLVERSVPEGTSKETTDRVFESFKAHYAEHSADKTRPYHGVCGMMQRVRESGVKLVILSNKADGAVKKLCEKYFTGLYDEALGERTGIPRKPDPSSVYEIMARYGMSQTETVYIGDSEVDVKTARNAKIDGLFVTWGFRSPEVLKENGAERIFDLPGEVVEAITR